MVDNRVEKFEDLIVWQEAAKLSVELYQQLKDCRDYGIKDQIQRSAISIPSNIAEGFERKSNKEFIQFLNIARRSTFENANILIILQKRGLISREKMEKLLDNIDKLCRQITNLQKTIR